MDIATHRWSSGRWLIGGGLIALGIVFLLMNIGMIERFSVWRFWPVILIVIGANKFSQSNQRAEGYWLMALGAWFQWSVLKIYGYGFRDTWPVVIVLFGIYLLWESIERESRRRNVMQTAQPNSDI